MLRVGVNDLFCGKNYVWPPAAAGKKLGHNQHQPGSQLETRRRDVLETGAKDLQNDIIYSIKAGIKHVFLHPCPPIKVGKYRPLIEEEGRESSFMSTIAEATGVCCAGSGVKSHSRGLIRVDMVTYWPVGGDIAIRAAASLAINTSVDG